MKSKPVYHVCRLQMTGEELAPVDIPVGKDLLIRDRLQLLCRTWTPQTGTDFVQDVLRVLVETE